MTKTMVLAISAHTHTHTLLYFVTCVHTLPGIVRYMQRQAGPSSRLLTSVEDGKQFSKSQTEVRVIGFFSSTTDPQVIKTYMESGNEVRMDMELGHATDEKIAQGMGFDVDTVGVFHSRCVETS